MDKPLRYTVRLLFIAYSISLLLLTFFYSTFYKNTNNSLIGSETSSLSQAIHELFKGIAESLRQQFIFACLLISLLLLFLILLKLVCRIKTKELLLFGLISVQGLFSLWLLLSEFVQNEIANYLLAAGILFINFLLLKFSDHWNYVADGLPD